MTEPRLEPQTIEPPHLGFAYLLSPGPQGAVGVFSGNDVFRRMFQMDLCCPPHGVQSVWSRGTRSVLRSLQRDDRGRDQGGHGLKWGTGEGGAKRDLGSGQVRRGDFSFLNSKHYNIYA